MLIDPFSPNNLIPNARLSAFGNYFDIAREVSYHPLMAIMLTYRESTSMAYSFEKDGLMLFPDEVSSIFSV